MILCFWITNLACAFFEDQTSHNIHWVFLIGSEKRGGQPRKGSEQVLDSQREGISRLGVGRGFWVYFGNWGNDFLIPFKCKALPEAQFWITKEFRTWCNWSDRSEFVLHRGGLPVEWICWPHSATGHSGRLVRFCCELSSICDTVTDNFLHSQLVRHRFLLPKVTQVIDYSHD